MGDGEGGLVVQDLVRDGGCGVGFRWLGNLTHRERSLPKGDIVVGQGLFKQPYFDLFLVNQLAESHTRNSRHRPSGNHGVCCKASLFHRIRWFLIRELYL